MGMVAAGQSGDVTTTAAAVEGYIPAEAKRNERKKGGNAGTPPLVHDSRPLMRLGGRVNERKCGDVLVDGGASSNFALRSWVKQAGLRIRPLSAPIDVTLADRGSVHVTEAAYVRSMTS
jgi:hypothetical protein